MKLMNTALPSLIAFALLITDVNGQVPDSVMHRVDSLRQLLPGTTTNEKYRLNFQIGYELFDLDNPEAIKHMEEAFRLSKVLGDSAEIVHTGRLYGQLLRRVGRISDARIQLNKLIDLALASQNDEELKALYNSLAISYMVDGVYDKALEYNFKSLEIRERQGDSVAIAMALGNIGTAYYFLGAFQQSKHFLDRSLQLDSITKNGLEISISRAQCEGRIGQTQKSRQALEQLLNNKLVSTSAYFKSRIYYGLAYLNFIEKRLSNASDQFETSLRFSILCENKYLECDNLLYLGEVASLTHNLVKAEVLFRSCKELAQAIHYKNAIEGSYTGLSKLYSVTGKHELASHMKSSLIAIKDSILNESVVQNISSLHSEYMQRENSRLINKQAMSLKNNAERIRDQTYIIGLTVVTVTLLIGVIVLLVRANTFRKRITAQLNDLVQERTLELKAYGATLQQLKGERSMMMKIVSGRIVSALATFRGLEVVAKSYDSVPDELVQSLRRAGNSLDDILDVVRFQGPSD